MLFTDNALAAKPTWLTLENDSNTPGTVNFRTYGMNFNSLFVRGDLIYIVLRLTYISYI